MAIVLNARTWHASGPGGSAVNGCLPLNPEVQHEYRQQQHPQPRVRLRSPRCSPHRRAGRRSAPAGSADGHLGQGTRDRAPSRDGCMDDPDAGAAVIGVVRKPTGRGFDVADPAAPGRRTENQQPGFDAAHRREIAWAGGSHRSVGERSSRGPHTRGGAREAPPAFALRALRGAHDGPDPWRRDESDWGGTNRSRPCAAGV